MHSLTDGFTDQRDREAPPKPRDCAADRKRGVPLYDCRSAKYEPYQSLRMHGVCDGGGEADERVAWRCSDCGLEAADCTADCCPKCGSCEPLEYR